MQDHVSRFVGLDGFRLNRFIRHGDQLDLETGHALRGELLPKLLGAPHEKRESFARGGHGGLCKRVSKRKVDRLVSELGIEMSKDQVSRICSELDDQVEAFRPRPLEGAHLYLWLDAEHLKVGDRGHVHSKARMVAFAVHGSDRSEAIGIEIAEPGTEAGQPDRARLAVFDDHLGLKAAIAKGARLSWQRCTVHFIRNMHGRCKKGWRNMVSAALRKVFTAEDLTHARGRSASVIECLAPTVPKVAAFARGGSARLLPLPAGALVKATLD